METDEDNNQPIIASLAYTADIEDLPGCLLSTGEKYQKAIKSIRLISVSISDDKGVTWPNIIH